MRRVEFLGVAGAGKTTYYKKLLQKKRSWISPSEARIHVVRNHFKGRFLGGRNWLIKHNLFPRYHARWAKERVLTYANSHYADLMQPYYDSWVKLFFNSYASASFISGLSAISHSRLFLRTLEDIMVFDSFLQNPLIVWDEGLLQHIPGDMKFEWVSQASEKERFNPVFPAGIVYFTAPSDVTFHRRKKRKHQQATTSNPNEIILNDSELKELCIQNEKVTSNAICNLKKADIPVLLVDTTQDEEKNLQQIQVFLQQLDSAPKVTTPTSSYIHTSV